MNHDCTHCLDWNENCPKECYRAQVTADLNNPNARARLLGIPLSWAGFAGTPECKRWGGNNPPEDLYIQYKNIREHNEFLRGYRAGYLQAVKDSGRREPRENNKACKTLE